MLGSQTTNINIKIIVILFFFYLLARLETMYNKEKLHRRGFKLVGDQYLFLAGSCRRCLCGGDGEKLAECSNNSPNTRFVVTEDRCFTDDIFQSLGGNKTLGRETYPTRLLFLLISVTLPPWYSSQ